MTVFFGAGGSGGSANPSFTKLENVAGTVINPATEDTLKEVLGFQIPVYDTILITYTDSTKATIATVDYKSSGVIVATVTLTSGSTTDTYVKTP